MMFFPWKVNILVYMAKKKDKKRKTITTKLSQHKRFKKELKPPFLQVPTNPSSWINDRLPEMLWAVLAIGNLNREKALNFFRFVADFVRKNPESYDLTISGIAKLNSEKRSELITTMLSWDEQIKTVLRPIKLFPEIPGVEEWSKYLNDCILEEDWQNLSKGITKTLWHQSEEATDCRWIKLLCIIIGGKLHFPQGMQDEVRGILEYPNYGDLRCIRPTIRAAEISFPTENMNWANHFWQLCYDQTACFPEEQVSKKIENRRVGLTAEMEFIKNECLCKTREIRNRLIDHFFDNAKNSSLDARLEGAFGLAFYAMTLFIELIYYRIPFSITSRINLRVMIETLITFRYLLSKEAIESSIWEGYRSYGTGQLKLLFLKIQELEKQINSVDNEDLETLVNEDKWLEFVPINLGHWDSTNTRKISEDIGLKDLYDTYYNYTSGYIHAHWGAVRESIYQRCFNPLHRLHRGPILDMPLMPSITKDAENILNQIFECLSQAYPKFDHRISFKYKNTEGSEKDEKI